MTQIQTDAIRKLTEAKVKTFQNKRDFLVPHLRNALCSFCEQDEDFAAAVMVDGKSLEGCVNDMKVPQGDRVALSAIDAYRMVVQYFAPERDVECVIKLSKPAKKQTSAKILDLKFEDLFKSSANKAIRPTSSTADAVPLPPLGKAMETPTKDGDGK